MARPRTLASAICLLAGLATPALSGAVPSPPAATKLRAGTFRRTEILVAYYRSAFWHKALTDKRAERDKAKANGDKPKAEQLEAWGAAAQHRAHRQLTGEVSLAANGLLDHLKKALPAVAAQAKIHLIVEQPLFNDDAVETIDVTDLIVKHFPPAPKGG